MNSGNVDGYMEFLLRIITVFFSSSTLLLTLDIANFFSFITEKMAPKI